MKEHDLTAWLDGELIPEDQQVIERELRQSPEKVANVASLIREQLLMAETLIEESPTQAVDCPECEAVEPSVEMLPNEEVFTAYVGGQLDEAQMKEIEEQIESDPVFKRELAEFCRQRFQMAEVLDATPGHSTGPVLNFPGSSPARAATRPAMMQSARQPKTPWLKIAAMLAILATGAWFLNHHLQDSGDTARQVAGMELDAKISKIIGEVSVLRNSERMETTAGMQLKDGDTIQTGSGQSVIRYEDGTSIQLRSYSQLKISKRKGAKQLELNHGLASAEVAPQQEGKALLINTSLVQVKVVGTAFILETSKDQSQLEMTEGSVVVTHISSGEAASAKAGESMTANQQGIKLTRSTPRVISFTLIDTDTKQPLTGYDPILPDSVIRLSSIQGRNLTLRANTIPKILDQVNLKLRGPKGYPKLKQEENYYPYLLTNNHTKSHWVDAAVYEPMPALISGGYTVTASADRSGQEPDLHTLRFSVEP